MLNNNLMIKSGGIEVEILFCAFGKKDLPLPAGRL
jgi:hypothetical protein